MSDHPSCIDISHWQGFPDFHEVAVQGVVACIMKATEGTSYVDPNRAQNYINATEAGIACCTYHWIKPGNAAAQMRFWLGTIDPVQGERMCIDYEEDGCSLDDLHEAVQVLLDDPRDLQVTVYSGHLLKEQLGDSCDAFLRDNTDLWLAQYTSGTTSWPTGTYEYWTLWQYSESGEVEGISDTNVDLNRFDGTNDQLVRWISPEGRAPLPPPQPGEVVRVDITAPKSVSVNVTVNGGDVATRRRRPRRRLLIPHGPDVFR
ncbi:glycoside hydrolase family 25 protein [Bradyrhizobium neotropicale]|uniref:glycoside hydrolase family 25 protein n=1 Tax=Bradyrhizobium neotropicale TaxID=1497615 RepID=UPI001AD66CF9|nr:glycoside hydrolase family 25 protein [Bradyrhizobium neotropicale]MBO4221933.1 cell-wall lytic protein [Bradyrhizobium neotropicale]